MTDLPEPTQVDRPTPSAIWSVNGGVVADHIDGFTVRRQDNTVRIRGYEGTLNMPAAVASQLAAALASAAEWTDDVVDAEILDFAPQTIDGDGDGDTCTCTFDRNCPEHGEPATC